MIFFYSKLNWTKYKNGMSMNKSSRFWNVIGKPPHTINHPRNRLDISPIIAHIEYVLKWDGRTGMSGAFFSNSPLGTIGTPNLGCVTKTGSATVCLEWFANSSPWIQGLRKRTFLGSFQLYDSQGFVHSLVPTTSNQSLQEANTSRGA